MDIYSDPFSAPVSLNTEEKIPETVSIDPGVPRATLTPEDAKARAFKAAYGLSDTPGVDANEIFTGVLNNSEDKVREQAASELQAQTEQKREQLLIDLVNQTPGTDLENAMKWYKSNEPIPYTADNVFERKYADAYIDTLDKFASRLGDDHFWTSYKNSLPESEFSQMIEYGSKEMAIYQKLQNTLVNRMSLMNKNQGWVGYTADFAKQFFAPYNEVKFRGLIPGVPWTKGLGLGEHFAQSRNKLFDMPLEEAFKTINQLDNSLSSGGLSDNHLASVFYLSQMLGQTSFERIMNNINTANVPFDVYGVGKTGKGVYNMLTWKSNVAKALADVAEASKKYKQTEADIHGAVGDAHGAAVADITESLKQQAKEMADTGVVVKPNLTTSEDGLQTLTRFMEQDKQKVLSDATLGQTAKNIIGEQIESSERLWMTALTNVLRPIRVPFQKATSEFLDKVTEAAMERYPALSNRIQGHPTVEYVPLANTYDVSAFVGAAPNKLFNAIEDAANWARHNGYHVSLDKDQIRILDGHIADVKAEIKAGYADMHADVQGMNRIERLEGELKDLQKRKAELSRPGGYRIQQQGAGFAIEFKANVKETDPLIRNFVTTNREIPDPNNKGKMIPNPNFRKESISGNSWTGFLSWLRSADDTLAKEQVQNRKAVTYAQALLEGLIQREAQYLKDVHKGIRRIDENTGEKIPFYKRNIPGVSRFLKRGEWKALNEALAFAQRDIGPDGIPGRYFDTPTELANWYQGNPSIGRLPSFTEQQAYFAVKRWDEFDRILREISAYRNAARLGAESHSILLKVGGETIRSSAFNGISMDELPRGRGNLAKLKDLTIDTESKAGEDILVVGSDANSSMVVNDVARLSGKKRDALHKLMSEEGYKLIRVYDPERTPLAGFVKNGDKRIEYILAKNIETSPLSWEQVPRRGGGHLVYDYEQYLKQPIIRSERVGGTLKHWYEGDRTVMPIKYAPMGKDIEKRYNEVRELLAKGDTAGAKAYANRWLPLTEMGGWNEFRSMFYPKKTPEGKTIPAQFNLKEPFRMVRRNGSIIKMDSSLRTRYGVGSANKGIFIDGTREGSLARNFQVEFTGERDARGMFTLDNKGTPQNPIYHTAEVDIVNPLDILQRATKRIADNVLMDDYKIAAVENWIKEALPYMDVKNDSQVLSAPFYYFNNTPWLKDAPFNEVWKLKGNKYKINQLLGQPTFTNKALHFLAQKGADMTYSAFGSGAANKLEPIWNLAKTSDPIAFVRSVAFHSYLGFMYVPQLWVQSATWVNIHAHSPRYASMATWAAMLHLYSRINRNPEILEHLDKLAGKMKLPFMPNWKPGEWIEANRMYMGENGFNRVGGELSILDVQRSAKIMQGAWGSLLHAGTLPMRAGDSWGRVGAWYTAFKEFREKNPLKKITNEDHAFILDRADTLYTNMSRASHSLLNASFAALPTQFYNYPIRLAEIFFSKRIGETPRERAMVRARLLGWNSFMFGLPMGAGVMGFPLSDWIREHAVEDGFFGLTGTLSGQDPNKPYSVTRERNGARDWVDHWVMEGGPATITAMMTGEHPNIGQRFGSQGIAMNLQDAGWWKLFGAAGQVIKNTFGNGNFDGLFESAGALFDLAAGKESEVPWAPKLRDMTDLINEIQTKNKLEAWYVAMNTGVLVSKNKEWQRDIGPWTATMYTIFGLRPQEQDDARFIRNNLADVNEYQKNGMKRMEHELNYYFIAESKGDHTNAQDAMNRASRIGMGYKLSPDQIGTVLANTIKDKSQYGMIERTAFGRYIVKKPYNEPEKEEGFRGAYGDVHNYIEKQRPQ